MVNRVGTGVGVGARRQGTRRESRTRAGIGSRKGAGMGIRAGTVGVGREQEPCDGEGGRGRESYEEGADPGPTPCAGGAFRCTHTNAGGLRAPPPTAPSHPLRPPTPPQAVVVAVSLGLALLPSVHPFVASLAGGFDAGPPCCIARPPGTGTRGAGSVRMFSWLARRRLPGARGSTQVESKVRG